MPLACQAYATSKEIDSTSMTTADVIAALDDPLMRRLIGYLRPYKARAFFALARRAGIALDLALRPAS